ncbi:uncharacterized protein EI90DRAFT_3014430 [Cantharellus anzutake]|uniref:uncharacterized protein n=1 Tax=Cantharellus anzutake TaxID=1750568 RepID=UPI00190887C1|nr:uncharacterized protein EI90DRAFT_3014430 [Cantharellus anzutake]KAF8335810.1 hypothetical protein EI90DRAFT_3014430 [Cantharellus anzutake]
MMFSNRILTLLLFIVSFGLFAYSKPIDSNALAARAISGDVAQPVGGLTPRGSCGCDNDLLLVLRDLHLKLKVKIDLLDGHHPIEPIIAEIIAIIDVAVKVIANIYISVDGITVAIHACVDIIVQIIVSIYLGIYKYGLIHLVVIISQLNVCITAFVKIIVHICPSFHDLLKVALSVHLDVLGIFVDLPIFLGISL